MKKILNGAVSLVIALLMILLPDISLLIGANAAEYPERGTLTFGSVELTLTELVENDYKITIPIKLDQEIGRFSAFQYGCYLDDGLSLYDSNDENSKFTYICHTGHSGKSENEIHKITLVVTQSATAGSKYTIKAAKYLPNLGRSNWADESGGYYFENMVDGVISIKPDSQTADGEFSPGFIGRGTSESPYLISSADDLIHLSELINNSATNPYCRNLYYKQTQDIDMSGINFEPIGSFYGTDGVTLTEDAVFSGHYNGGKHKITNLKVKSYSKFCGLFGRIGESSVTENECEIYNLSVYGDISSSNAVVGGIVGEMGYGASVWNCAFHGDVSGTDHVGGIAGSIYEGGKISGSYFNGTVTSSGTSSGIVASVNIGNTSNSKSASIKSCYTNGTLNGSTAYAIVGECFVRDSSEVSVSLNKNFFSSNTSQEGTQDKMVGCTRLSDEALKACADMLSGYYSSDLDMINDGYPVLEWELSPYKLKGSGAISDPYQIGSKEDLLGMQRNLLVYPDYYKSFYIQTADIDMENEEFIPIGIRDNLDEGKIFTGCYNGNRHAIKNLNINYQGSHSVGLFSYIDCDALIKDLVVYGEVKGRRNAGGIVGSASNSTVDNCAFIGNVTSSEGGAGGIIGWIGIANKNFELKNCYHNGTISGATYASGIIGSSGNSCKCLTTDNKEVTGDILISNSFHVNGKITAQSSANSYGVIAMNMNWLEKMFSNPEEHIPDVIVSNCYVTTGLASNITCPYAKSDNTTALIQSQMKQIAPDLGDAFITNPNEKLNNGYPVFKWQISDIQGDVNADGKFNVSDVVIFQKWLLADPSAKLDNWKAADFCEDNRLDVFDLCLMKRALVEK